MGRNLVGWPTVFDVLWAMCLQGNLLVVGHKAAGLPNRALKAAQKHLDELEAQAAAVRPQLDIFSTLSSENEYGGFSPNETADIAPQTAASQETNPAHHALAEALNQIRPDDLTPREALDALYHLKQIVEGVEGGE